MALVIIFKKALDPHHYALYECLNKHIKEKGEKDTYTQIFFWTNQENFRKCRRVLLQSLF